jgi:hypothetical protein
MDLHTRDVSKTYPNGVHELKGVMLKGITGGRSRQKVVDVLLRNVRAFTAEASVARSSPG